MTAVERPDLHPDDEVTPAQKWDEGASRRALDELFGSSRRYKSGEQYQGLMRFVSRFKFYSPFNAMLVHVQLPGARYVATGTRWLREFRRVPKPEARPLVILQPMGPVLFVFDVIETEALEGAPNLPDEIANPFAVRRGRITTQLHQTIENAKRDGIKVVQRPAGSCSAGSIRRMHTEERLQITRGPRSPEIEIPVRYQTQINSNMSKESQYATLVHELGHLYCGHLGVPNGEKWWPDRRGLTHEQCEFEAESICHLVCSRLGIDNPSEAYLANFFAANTETPTISLDCVMKAAGLIEQMGREWLKLRK